jgi:hypothetical protein
MATDSGKNSANKRIPSAADYARALRSLVPLPPRYIAMKQLHWQKLPVRVDGMREIQES